MYYRVLFLIPEGLTFDMLNAEQQAAIQSVLGQFVLPMPSTIPFGGKVVCDGLAAENFDPERIGSLGLPFEIIGLWGFDGKNAIEVAPLNETAFMAHLPLDENGGPQPLHEPHRWSGWPELF